MSTNEKSDAFEKKMYQPKHASRVVVIGVAGAIGVGKSTFCCKLRDYLSGEALPPINTTACIETVDKSSWQNYRTDPGFYAASFQDKMAEKAVQRVEMASEAHKFGVTVAFVDQPPEANHEVFAAVNHDDGNISERYYSESYLPFVRPHKKRCDLIVYLDAPPEVLKKRVMERDRIGEESYSSEYMAKLQSAFCDMVLKLAKPDNQQRLLVLNWENFSTIDMAAVWGRIEAALRDVTKCSRLEVSAEVKDRWNGDRVAYERHMLSELSHGRHPTAAHTFYPPIVEIE